MKKILSLMMAVVLAVCVIPVSVFAETNYDTATKIELSDPQKETLGEKWYKIKTEKGVLQIDFSTSSIYSYLFVFDEDGAQVTVKSLSYKAGSLEGGGEGKNYVYSEYNSNTEKMTLTAKYEVEAAYYYIRITHHSAYWYDSDDTKEDKDYTLTASMSNNVEEVVIQYLGVELKVGNKLKLKAVLSASGGEVEWKSSKSSVASVSSSGVVTAKEKGTAVITATCGRSVAKIKIKVS